jgi:hypothetical protein
VRLLGMAAGLTAALAIAGCSSDTPGTSTTTATCTAKITGAVTATFSCSVTDVYTIAGSTSILTISGGGSGVTMSFGLGIAGSPQETILTNTSTGVTGSITVTTGTASWLSSNTGAPQGTFNLSIASLSVQSSTVNGATYLMGGTLIASLPPAGGTTATGTVAVEIDFSPN